MERSDGKLTTTEANNARILNVAVAELRQRTLKALQTQNYGKVSIELNFDPGKLKFVRAVTEETHK